MAIEVASLFATLGLDKKSFDEGLAGAKESLGSFGATMGGVLESAGGFLVAQAVQMGISTITNGIRDSIAAGREAIAINKDLEQTIKSTGGAAGITADAARKLADELSRVTNFEDDSIVKGEAMLLTFTNIGQDVFPRATETMLDMAQKFGSMDSASVQLGKALNDPIRGIAALTRIGVQFSDQQKEQIKGFMATNDIAKAQGVILDELAREFGGQARALADPIIQLQNAWGNLQEKVGTNVLLPVLTSLAQVAIPAVNAAIDSFKTAIAGLSEKEVAAIAKTLTDLGGVVIGAANAFGEVGKGINSVAQGLGLADKNSTGLGVALKALGVVLTASAAPIQGLGNVLNIIGAILQSIGYIIQKVGEGYQNLTSKTSALGSVSLAITTIWNGWIVAAQTLWQWIQNLVSGWQRLVATLSQALNIPPVMLPGSPTPLELGLRGIASAINTMPPLSSGFSGMVPMAAGGGNSNVTNIHLGGQSFSFSGSNQQDQAIIAMIQYLRAQLSQ